MTRIHDLLAAGRTTSFEFMPPRSPAGEQRLRRAIDELRPLSPSFVSVTYGAGGSTRQRTHDIVADLVGDIVPMAHVTAWGHTRDELTEMIAAHHRAGVRNILALRGDPPGNDPDMPIGDLPHAVDLVRLVREVAGDDISVGVAAQPQVHPASPDRASDRRHLAAKLREADFGVTQFFFRVEDYTSMVDELRALGCTTPVIAGIMPITRVAQVERFAALSGHAIPEDLAGRLHAVADDPEAVRAIGVEAAVQLCRDLHGAGAPGLHFYTLNTSLATREVLAELHDLATPTP